ncbi:MAG: glycerophosphodiester phosphodiesterase [Verrucomicrobia bacterium]|nr:glycerophosphodiester phosphodiesterase [Verrucomicrobiota bacterium]MDA0725930.1 glycerophosphodiester phosphodiesterase [Verrucomicrobiota bacterium]MDA1046439.1 glycerophosphodiester phosphodiesterase [Verrucomicrobiota bacterium]
MIKIPLVVASSFFACAPALYAKPLVVAHRGASQDAPENTLAAFMLAWEQGADAIEGDFLLTKDNEIVCIHDKSTERLAGRKLIVKGSTLAQLQELDVGLGKGGKFTGTKIPTIAEVLATIPAGKKIFIEIKCGKEIIPPLLEEIKKSELNDEQVTMICFNTEVVRMLKIKAPQHKVYWLSNFKRNKEGHWVPSLETVLQTLSSTKADGLDSHHGIPEHTARRIQEEGFEWHVWTVNDLKTAKRLKALGVESVTTDVPGHLKKAL